VKEEDEQKEMEEAAREAESAKGAEDQGATPEAESEGEDELALVGKDPGQV